MVPTSYIQHIFGEIIYAFAANIRLVGFDKVLFGLDNACSQVSNCFLHKKTVTIRTLTSYDYW
ncbi:hypothetical protein JCM15457_1936 [Liquorilactobacillus sucicola DSM 21376 = JCM 15457]|uniref:Uncharacterized protein n=1 Tax=Liquorilactobacillus sucicola DSM 21376 = JCM 15457 TaxID=1423806 RepID=A0A023CYL7_9LACO|nr:hypothetical protein FD15_GL000267 [Liquorilactobacillus sucicola DSM 21376 = JCM 15457]GAJ26982.1 hypothetical protein JCM15457_1936 [Liquorilactobacillus sucicola DSM 21376 = JCM 15457]